MGFPTVSDMVVGKKEGAVVSEKLELTWDSQSESQRTGPDRMRFAAETLRPSSFRNLICSGA